MGKALKIFFLLTDTITFQEGFLNAVFHEYFQCNFVECMFYMAEVEHINSQLFQCQATLVWLSGQSLTKYIDLYSILKLNHSDYLDLSFHM